MSSPSRSALSSRLRHAALVFSLSYGAFALLQVVALDVVKISCPLYHGTAFQVAQFALAVGLLPMLPLWLYALVSLAWRRRILTVLLAAAGIAAILMCVHEALLGSLFYCDDSLARAAMVFHGH